MIKKDLIEKIKDLKDDEDVNSLLGGTDIETQFKGAEPTLDTFKQKSKTDKDFKSYFESENDKYHAKAVKTMKESGSWEGEFSDVMKTKYPELIVDAKDKKIFDLEKRAEASDKAVLRKDLLAQAVAYATSKGIKVDAKYIGKLLGEDLDSTKLELDGFAENWSTGMETSMNERLKASSYVPGGTDKDGAKVSIGASMAQQNNGAKVTISDPWASK